MWLVARTAADQQASEFTACEPICIDGEQDQRLGNLNMS